MQDLLVDILMKWNSAEWNSILDFVVVYVCIYWVLYFIRGTRTANILIGITILLTTGYTLANKFHMIIVSDLLKYVIGMLPVLLIFIFQSELRRVFAQAGSFFLIRETSVEMVDEVTDAVLSMSKSRTGALIVFERNIGLASIINSSVKLDAAVKSQLLQSLFYKNSTLHDGAVVIREEKIAAARAILPLAMEGDDNPAMKLGTRHRAAVGITEETDAVALAVSEETGIITVANKGRLIRGMNKDQLRNTLYNLLKAKTPEQIAMERKWTRFSPRRLLMKLMNILQEEDKK